MVFKGARQIAPTHVSRDGASLLYFDVGAATGNDVFTIPLTGERTPVPVVQTPFVEAEPRWSPDGTWLAYVSNETGRFEVYVQP